MSKPVPEGDLTREEVEKLSHISDSTINKDIYDTNRELLDLAREVQKREKLVDFLKRLQAGREKYK